MQTVMGRTISAWNLTMLLFGLFAGFILGAVLPGNLPGMRRGTPSRIFAVAASTGIPMIAEQETALPTVENAPLAAAQAYNPASRLGELPMDSKESFMQWMSERTGEQAEYLEAKWELSRRFVESGELQGIAIEAFLKTPRELFVREKNLSRAYDDIWLPIGYGATITDPDIVCMMTTTLDVKPGHKVLEIGTGSGYQSAILSFMTKNVFSIEIIEPLFWETSRLYDSLQAKYPGFHNIKRKLGDGFYGWEKYAPFDRIIVTCSIDHLPPPLIRQLSPDGIMVVPLGPPGRQYIMEVKKTVGKDGAIHLKRRDVYNGLSVTFIPFRNEAGKSYSGGMKN